MRHGLRRRFGYLTVSALLLGLVFVPQPSRAGDGPQLAQAASQSPAAVSAGASGLLIPHIDPRRGRDLFVNKGCVLCHSINDVGGRAAPPLDVPEDQPYANLFDFVANMLRGAQAMADLQEMDLGYRIELTGAELADIVGFAYDHAEQQQFSEDDIPEVMRSMMLEQPY